MIAAADLERIEAYCNAATDGPWFTVESPWRASHYNKDTGLHEAIGTYVVAGSPDPHAGTPVVDSIEIDKWPADEGPDYSQSDTDLAFCASARTDLPACIAEIRRLCYWLLRAYQSGHREGWEEGPSVRETMDRLHAVLCRAGLDPNGSLAEQLLADGEPAQCPVR